MKLLLNYTLTTSSGLEHYEQEVQDSLNNDESYIHGNLAVLRDTNAYINGIKDYSPKAYSDFKDAYLAFIALSATARESIPEYSYRTASEIMYIISYVISEIHKDHLYDVYAFLDITIENMVKTTRNTSRYNKILKKVDKAEVDSLIGQYIDNILSDNLKDTAPTAMQDVIAKALRPAIIDIAYAFNVEKRPSRWKTESSVVKMAIKIFKGHKIIEQGSPDFLLRQRYDVWIPSLKLAIEYNGKQHYEYVPFFHKNGEEDLLLQQERDNKKRSVSNENGIKLIEIPYTEKDIELYINSKI